ncbi:MAG: hypothetical protein HC803_08790 [Saprospiraceae bacterium]|nr:hypothetical protein [Saprospiraceae bacterium]
MRKLFTVLVTMFLLNSAFAGTGVFQTYAIFNTNGAGNFIFSLEVLILMVEHHLTAAHLVRQVL